MNRELSYIATTFTEFEQVQAFKNVKKIEGFFRCQKTVTTKRTDSLEINFINYLVEFS